MTAIEDIQKAAERVKAEGRSKPRVGRHPVNQPMIDHWLDAIGDKNPIYVDESAARAVGHPGVVGLSVPRVDERRALGLQDDPHVPLEQLPIVGHW